jgi:hypothetical protein
MAEAIYKILERLGGEKGGKALIAYRVTQALKMLLLVHFIK